MIRLKTDNAWVRAEHSDARPQDPPIYLNVKACDSNPPAGFTMEDEAWPLVQSFAYLTINEARQLLGELSLAVFDAERAHAASEGAL